MTVTTYIATFADAQGGTFHGSIFWDKHTPGILTATLGRYLPGGQVDFPTWDKSNQNTARRERGLVAAIKHAAALRGWYLQSEEYTCHAANFDTPTAILMDLYRLLRDARNDDGTHDGELDGILNGGICAEVLARAERFLYPEN